MRLGFHYEVDWFDKFKSADVCLWLASGRLSVHFRAFSRFTLLNNDHEIVQTKLCVSPDFPEKPWFQGTNTLRGFSLLSNRKLLRSPPSCLLPFHVRNSQSSSAESTDHSGSACDVWCPEGKRTHQRRWRRIICLPVMEHNIAVKMAIFPVFGWKFPGKQDTAETHPGRGYVSTRSQISLISFFSLTSHFPLIKPAEPHPLWFYG